MYKLRYGRTYNMGNYQSERLEVERDFPEETPRADALLMLIHEVEELHAVSVEYLREKQNG